MIVSKTWGSRIIYFINKGHKTQVSLTLLRDSSIILTKKLTKQKKRKREMDGVIGLVIAFSATKAKLYFKEIIHMN